MSHISHYDSNRETVGKIYRDAQINNREEFIEIGDMAHELHNSLIEDINEAIKNFDKKEPKKPYYLLVEETRDLQMKNAIKRRIHYFGYRPWPEDNTLVFWKNPKTQELRFCWCLPHWSEMETTLLTPQGFDPAYIQSIKAWLDFDMKHFGFYYDKELKWIPDPTHKDQTIKQSA